MRSAALSFGPFLVAVAVASLASEPALAQKGATYQITESGFVAGGVPLASEKFQVTLSSAGATAAGTALSSPSYGMDVGYSASFPPAGEVSGLLFADRVTLIWNPEPSVGDYNVYRGMLTRPFDPTYGSCFAAGVTTENTVDTDEPSASAALFYLVTARNRLAEEGTKGHTSDGIERANPAPCP